MDAIGVLLSLVVFLSLNVCLLLFVASTVVETAGRSMTEIDFAFKTAANRSSLAPCTRWVSGHASRTHTVADELDDLEEEDDSETTALVI